MPRRPFATPVPPGALALLALVLAGCLPTCRRDTDRRLVPEDSLGRRVAESTPADSLDEVWRRTAADVPGLAHPRTARWDAAGRLWVTDVKAGRLHAFDAAGRPLGAWAPGFAAPYLAGFLGDTVVVFSAGANRFDLFAGDRVARRVPAPNLGGDRALVRYGHVWGDGFAVKAASETTPPFLMQLGPDGRLRSQTALPGPHWRHAGLLRARPAAGGTEADTLWSLCGYRPVADRLTRGGGRLRREAVALVGFDSPKLAQSRLFLLGEETPPLLSSSAAPAAGGRLFALNLRTGWLLVDVFGGDGRLQRRLSSRRPGFDPDYFVEDLDVRRDSAGWLLATVQAMPAPRVTVYRWADAPADTAAQTIRPGSGSTTGPR